MSTLKQNIEKMTNEINNNSSIFDLALELINQDQKIDNLIFNTFIEALDHCDDVGSEIKLLSESGVLHDIFMKIDENQLIQFLYQYSSYIDLNKKHLASVFEEYDSEETLLHILSSKDTSGIIMETVFNMDLEFLTAPDVYATDGQEKIPLDVANNPKSCQIIQGAMDWVVKNIPNIFDKALLINKENFNLLVDALDCCEDVGSEIKLLSEVGILHDIFIKINEEQVIQFLEKFSPLIDLNIKHEGSGFKNYDQEETLLHILSAKDKSSSLIDKVFNQKLIFLTTPDVYAMNKQNKMPLELTNNKKTQQVIHDVMINDLPNRIVLVTAVETGGLFNVLSQIASLADIDVDYVEAFQSGEAGLRMTRNIVGKAIANSDYFLKDDATFASHLNFELNQYDHSLVERPHIHWTWNGLVHPNSGGNWESALVAFIEPFKNMNHVMGCAPYDTMTIGPHKLSQESCILIPNEYAPDLKLRLEKNGYKGKVIAYDSHTISLRNAVYNAIKTHYPDTFELLNKNKSNIATIHFNDKKPQNYKQEGYHFQNGNFNELYLKTKHSHIHLMNGDSDIKYSVLKAYAHRRLMGLHGGSPTDIEGNALIKLLKTVTKFPKDIQKPVNHRYFIGKESNKKRNELVSLEVYQIYKNIYSQYDKTTGAHDFANYLVKKALIADFRSMTHENLSNMQLKQMIETHFDNLLSNLSELHHNFNNTNLSLYRDSITNILKKPVKIMVQSNQGLFAYQEPPKPFEEGSVEEENKGSILANPLSNNND